MKKHLFCVALTSVSILFHPPALRGQAPQVEFPAASPLATVEQRVGITDLKVVYSRPGVKNRKIYGGLVPFGEVWRTGANAATKISFSAPVKLNGAEVQAGEYALYTIPGNDEWTVILHRNTGLWGAFEYDPKDDVARVTAKPLKLAGPVETFSIGFDQIRDNSATMLLDWESTRVPVQVEVDVLKPVLESIDRAMATTGAKPARLYSQAASFYLENDQDLDRALDWLAAGLGQQPDNAYHLMHVKAKVLAKKGDKEGAVAAARESADLATRAGRAVPWVQMNEAVIESLK